MKRPHIFISYSWANKKIADKIYYDLTIIGFDVIKDDHNLQYTNSIPDFMDEIRKADFAILLICDTYLKSINCMSEVMLLEKEDDAWKKILPIICKDANFYELLDRIKYVNYWQEKSEAIESALKNLDPLNLTSTYEELKSHKIITQNIDSFLINLKDQLNVSPSELFEKFYSPIIKRIGVDPDFTLLGELIPISFIPDPNIRLTTINNFVKKHKIESSYSYSIIASSYRDLKQEIKAIQFYKKAIALDDFNYTAWNNLGQVYEKTIHNYAEARLAYENAIICKPNFDIPRLNLGVLLSSHFNDVAGAKEQYEAILKFDENNPKAHNNLANIYKATSFIDLDKAEKHFIIAVKQQNLEATLGYANFLKAFKKNIALGNSYYLKAKELDTKKLYSEFIEIMLKNTKG